MFDVMKALLDFPHPRRNTEGLAALKYVPRPVIVPK